MRTNKKSRTRKLKVYYGHHGNYKQHPVIRLGGNYLASWGFKIGDVVELTFEENRLVITKLP
jgi:hypothetical protein